MKRTPLYLSLALLVTCCTEPQYQSNPKQYTFSAFGEGVTRTSLSGSSVLWATTDKISVFGSEELVNRCFSNKSTVSGVNARFTGLAQESDSFIALYPYTKNATCDADFIVGNVELPVLQEAKAESFGNGTNLSLATAEANGTLSFKNVGGLLAVRFRWASDATPHSIAQIGIRSAGSTMSGTASIGFDTDTKEPYIQEFTSSVDSVRISGNIAAGSYHYAVVYPGTYENITITLTDTEGCAATFTNSSLKKLGVGRNSNTVIADFEIPAAKTWTKVRTPMFCKVKSSSEMTGGQYIFVYEKDKNSACALNGALTKLDVSGNYVEAVRTSDSTIAVSALLDSALFTFDSEKNTFTNNHGKYLDGSENKSISLSTIKCEIKVDANLYVRCLDNNCCLSFNSYPNADRFRFYQYEQDPIKVYRRNINFEIKDKVDTSTVIPPLPDTSDIVPPIPDTSDIVPPTPDTTVLTPTTNGWFEQPAMYDADKDGICDTDKSLYYAAHSFTMNNRKYRNYTVCYSAAKHCPMWVAAPRSAVYSNKGTSRSDAYKADPDIPSSIQYNSKSTGGSCNKGHMLGSAERLCCAEANRQVFYYTNIAPQLSSGFNTGGGGWNILEDWVDGQVELSDTLYEVVGCYFDKYTDGYGYTVSPATISFGGRSDVVRPSMFYYILLRKKSTSNKKPVNQCTATELQCAAFVRSHTNSLKGQKPSSTEMMSVADLEKITGFTYFVNVPNAPKSTYKASDWGL